MKEFQPRYDQAQLNPEPGEGSRGGRQAKPIQVQPPVDSAEGNSPTPLSPEQQRGQRGQMEPFPKMTIEGLKRHFRDLDIVAANMAAKMRPLSPEEKIEKRRKYQRDYYQENKKQIREKARRAYKRRKERRRLQAEQQKPIQVFPPTPAKG
jgi:hypothetical protein